MQTPSTLAALCLLAISALQPFSPSAFSSPATLPALDHSLGNARASTSGDTLTVTTGAITQQWTLVPTGFATTSLVNPATGKEWCTPGNTTCDWAFYGLLDNRPAKLISLTAATDNDEGFAAPHIRVLAEFEYPAAATTVRYEIRAYPGANGLMTRLWFKGDAAKHHNAKTATALAQRTRSPSSDIVNVRPTGSKKPWFTPFALNTPQPDWFNSVARDPAQPLKIALDNLDPAKTYRIGMSFFNNVTDQTLTQSVKLASGARTTTVIDNVELKPHAKTTAKPAPAPQTIFFDIPAGKLAASTATLIVANKKPGEISMASEVIVYEKTDNAQPSIREIMFTVPARKPQLIAAAPAGYRLVGYGSLGGRTGNAPVTTPPNGHLARLPIAAAANTTRLYAGYFADTQNRNLRETPLLHEETYTTPIEPTTRERIGWASFVVLQSMSENTGTPDPTVSQTDMGAQASRLPSEQQAGRLRSHVPTDIPHSALRIPHSEGLILLKESHKCINSYGCDTGDFTLDATSLTNTGLGLEAKDIVPTKYTPGWANWTILYTGTADAAADAAAAAAAIAIKKFDRTRFPLTGPLKLMSNFWGSSTSGKPSPHYAAREENILKEIATGADLGVEVVQIDDGWQGLTFDHWRPVPYLDAAKKYPVYPEGWKNVRAAAAKAGLELGLWAAEQCPLADLKRNYDEGDFRYFKIDFAHMNDRPRIDALTGKARQLILHTGHKAIINWDLTEIVPRVGVYYGREYGNLFLENRRPNSPLQVTYIPYLVLRDAWHIAKYVNLNKVQIDIQNRNLIPAKLSNARQYDQAYLTAIALMSSPLIFGETQKFDASARAQMRPLIAAWKKEKAALARGYVHPIGSEPDDASWTGFQNHIEGTADGHLLLFRELNNKENSSALALKDCANKTLRLTDLLTGETRDAPADAQGRVTFTMDKPGDYRFYKYTIL